MPIRVYYEVLNQKGTPALYSDNYAQRPAAGYTGRIFYSPDTAQIFYDTGTTWTLLADAGVGSGSLASVCANGNTTATGIIITAGGLSTNSLTSTNLTAGSIPFIGTGGLFSQDNTNLFWDNTNKYFGINTNTPSTYLDVHGTNNVLVQINNTTTADSKIAFLNASVGKWRIGNLYSAGNNLFHIYNNTAGNNAMTITSGNVVTFTGTTITNSYFSTAFGINLSYGGVIIQSGQTALSGISQGIILGLASGVSQQLYFPTGTAYIYTYPSATGTLVNGTSFTSGVIPKYSATAGVLTSSMLSDDGTTLTSAGATRSNLYLKAVDNTYYGQLAFTNGSNGSYGGISYNNSSQYMQFEASSSEWARLYGNGNFRIFSTSATDSGNKFQVEGTSYFSGNVGIGTATPAQRLDINGTTGTIAQIKDTGTFAGLIIDASGTPFTRWSTYGTGKLEVGYYNNNFYFNNNVGQNDTNAAMVITSSGNVGIGTTNPSAKLQANTTTAGSTEIGFQLNDASTRRSFFIPSQYYGYMWALEIASNGGKGWSFGSAGGGGEVGSIVINASTTNYNTTSDYRLKEDFKEFNALDILSNVKIYDFKWKKEDNRTHGVIAHELQSILPYAVTGQKDELDFEGKILAQSVDYSKLIPVTIKAVQELNNRVTALEQNLN